MFQETALAATKANNCLATIDAQVYNMAAAGYLDYGISDDAIDPSKTIHERVIVFCNKVIAGREVLFNFYC